MLFSSYANPLRVSGIIKKIIFSVIKPAEPLLCHHFRNFSAGNEVAATSFLKTKTFSDEIYLYSVPCCILSYSFSPMEQYQQPILR
jgi:hypothetical protein